MKRTIQSHPKAGEPGVGEVIPYGRYGVGMLTGHPIGLVIVIGLLLMGFVGIPEARWFLVASLALGGVCGFALWLKHR